MEVIYTGIRQSVESIVQAAVQEDVDVLGLSSLAGAHDLLPDIIQRLKDKGRDDVLILAGGIIPDEDIQDLKAKGVSEVFQPGSRIKDIAQYIRDKLAEMRKI
jgi:methylmalonyl-CoA mutase C-terminal domain/subunit